MWLLPDGFTWRCVRGLNRFRLESILIKVEWSFNKMVLIIQYQMKCVKLCQGSMNLSKKKILPSLKKKKKKNHHCYYSGLTKYVCVTKHWTMYYQGHSYNQLGNEFSSWIELFYTKHSVKCALSRNSHSFNNNKKYLNDFQNSEPTYLKAIIHIVGAHIVLVDLNEFSSIFWKVQHSHSRYQKTTSNLLRIT